MAFAALKYDLETTLPNWYIGVSCHMSERDYYVQETKQYSVENTDTFHESSKQIIKRRHYFSSHFFSFV